MSISADTVDKATRSLKSKCDVNIQRKRGMRPPGDVHRVPGHIPLPGRGNINTNILFVTLEEKPGTSVFGKLIMEIVMLMIQRYSWRR